MFYHSNPKMTAFFFLACIIQAHLASTQCESEWEKVLQSNNTSSDYQKMSLYSGFTINNLGNFDSCNNIEIASYALIVYNQAYPKIIQAFCGPKVCTAEDYITSKVPFLAGTPSEIVFPLIYQEEFYSSFTVAAKLMGVFIVVLILIAGIGTRLEYLDAAESKPSAWHQFFICFSLIKNWNSLLIQRSQQKFGKSDPFDILDFLRVVLYHSVLEQFEIEVLINFDSMQELLAGKQYIIVYTASYAVSAFFWVSGFIMTYFFLVELEKNSSFTIIDLLKMYLNRYIRLTPPIIFVIFFFMSFQQYLGSGPLFYNIENNSVMKDCRNYFSTNLLYLNNWIPAFKGNSCLSPSWYLAVDMQFFLLFSVIILLYSKVSKFLGWALLIICCCSAMTVSISTAAYYHLKAGLFLNKDNQEAFDQLFYKQLFLWLPPYMLSVGAGIIVYSYRQLQHSKVVYDSFANSIAKLFENIYARFEAILLGPVILTMLILMQFDLFSHPGKNFEYEAWSDTANYVFLPFSQLLIGIGLSFSLLPLLMGHFPRVIRVMAYYPWNVLAKLTFVVYLIHKPIISILLYSSRTAGILNMESYIKNTIYVFTICCVFSLPIIMLVQFPAVNLTYLMFRRQPKQQEYAFLKSEDPDLKDKSSIND
jgi:peptidoglycan/LPS O-acetylase OafA/YrhL